MADRRGRSRTANGRIRQEPGRGPRMSTRQALGWALAALLVTGQIAISESLIRRRAALRLVNVDLPLDPFLRKAETARRAITAVAGATAGRRVSAVFVIPEQGWSRAGPPASCVPSWATAGAACDLPHPRFGGVREPLDSGLCGLRSLLRRAWTGNVADLGRGPEAHQRAGRVADRGQLPGGRACRSWRWPGLSGLNIPVCGRSRHGSMRRPGLLAAVRRRYAAASSTP